jgi:hypothetical protein
MGESQELLTAKRHFYEHYYYSVELLQQQLLAEVDLYRNDQWSAPRRAARISAMVKRYKTSQMLVYVFDLASKVELDITPLAAKRLCRVLFNRIGSQDIIVGTFGQKGRSKRSDISPQAAIDEIASRYVGAARAHWAGTLTDIEQAKNEYKSKIQIHKRQSKL